MRHIIIYHQRDLDGECSAAIVVNFLAEQCPQDNIELLPTDYGWEHPLQGDIKPVSAEDHVYMVDFSLPLRDMQAINDLCHFTWIDHHTSRLQEAEQAGFLANAGQSLAHDAPAACVLTWRFFRPYTELPEAVRLLGTYDAWVPADDWNRKVLPFQVGMQAQHTEPDSSLWTDLLTPGNSPRFFAWVMVDRIVYTGQKLRAYRTKEREFLVKQAVPFGLSANGSWYHCLTVNSLDIRADFWDEMLTHAERAQYDLLINYGYDGQPGWRVTLSPADRENGPDCSQIAKSLGGGGHPGRAGFCCQFPPFLPRTMQLFQT